MDHSIRAAELFCQGYNCAQAIAVAFSDVTGLEPAYAAKMASSFGGGLHHAHVTTPCPLFQEWARKWGICCWRTHSF